MTQHQSLCASHEADPQSPSWECSWCGHESANCQCGEPISLGYVQFDDGTAVEIIVGWDGE